MGSYFHRPRLLGLVLSITTLGLPLAAQDVTRESLIEKERAEKATKLQPDEVSKTERFLRQLKDKKYLERFAAGYNGWRAKIGNVVTGGGFAIGPEYYRSDLYRGQLTARASAQITTRGYQKLEAQGVLPKLWHGKLQVEALASHRNYNSLPYYGPGPDSNKYPRTNYRLEDTSVDGFVAIEPVKHVKFGTSFGYLWTNVGPGQSSRFQSADTTFSPAVVPGLDRQSNFFRNTVLAQYDYRDNPLGSAKSGGNYIFQYGWYHDQKFDSYSFRRMDIELQQFLPVFNKTRVLALRAKTTMTDTDRNQLVPFYLQPIIGGSDDLRGYRPFRFNDRNSLVMNAEYRWEIFSGLDGAIFADAGKVAPRRGLINFKDLESDVGFGLRFNARNRTFIRVDVGFSHEGFQVWFKFNDVFLPKRFGTSAGQPVY